MIYFDNKKVLVYKHIFWFSLIYEEGGGRLPPGGGESTLPPCRQNDRRF